MPTIQLAVAPIEVLGAPPRIRNVVSSGAMVWPLATHHAEPRQINRPPRVTMKAGIAK